MAALTIGTGASSLSTGVFGRGRIVFQNLGPGVIYFDADAVATTTTGLQLPVGAVYEFPVDTAAEVSLSFISTQASTDLRYVNIGGD